MSTETKTKPSLVKRNKRKRKDPSLWKRPVRNVNTVPLNQRGAFQLQESAFYISVSKMALRRFIKRGLIRPLPGFRHILITKAELDRFLREQTDIAKIAA